MNLPASGPFFNTRADRLQLARRRYFEEGITPVGVIDEAIFQSWARCQRIHERATRDVAFQPVTTSRKHLALQKSRHLVQAWEDELPQLESILSTTSCAAMLTDASGLLIGASCAGRSHEELMPIATRLGVDLSEDAVGTTAPGIVARTGQPHVVLGGEHFFESVNAMNCAAAPIRDTSGKLAGVLDISSESLPFGFDAASVVGFFAGAIENRLLISQSNDHLVLRLQVSPSLLDSAMVGLVGISESGQLAWSNGVAAKLLGLTATDLASAKISAESILTTSLRTLIGMHKQGPQTIRLCNGLQVWVRAEMRARDGRDVVYPVSSAGQSHESPSTQSTLSEVSQQPEMAADIADVLSPNVSPDAPTMPVAVAPPIAPTTSTLRDSGLDIIRRTVDECGGNIAKAAKILQVSRGLIYRRLRASSSSEE